MLFTKRLILETCTMIMYQRGRTGESTVEHTLECKALIGSNEIVTYFQLLEKCYGAMMFFLA